MDVCDEMIGTERRRGMERWGTEVRSQKAEGRRQKYGARTARELTVAGMSRARTGYREGLTTKTPRHQEGSGRGTKNNERSTMNDVARSVWIECRACEHRERVTISRTALVERIEEGRLRCRCCGGRMVEG